MPKITKLVPVEQAWALVAYLESQGGTVDVSAADIQAAAALRRPPRRDSPAAAPTPRP
jgi:mono/diheme cytochrome c family protein